MTYGRIGALEHAVHQFLVVVVVVVVGIAVIDVAVAVAVGR